MQRTKPRLFGQPPVRVAEFADPALGVLVYDANDEAWLKTVEADGLRLRLSIGGDSEPHEVLRQNAARLEAALPELLAQVPELLQRGAMSMPPLAGEISSLEVHEIAFWWDKEPDVAMVWLRGGSEGRMWHSTYKLGRLGDLAFDD
jgi:hypothetical protein